MLWPFALKAAADILNTLSVDLEGKTPDMKFSGAPAAHIRAKNFHTFGCLCCILDSQLQENPKGVPKWEPRSRLGIYVDRYPAHTGNVALVLNPKSGLVSPQFHVIFDDDFSTVPNPRAGTVPSNWASLVENSRELTTEEHFDISKTWFDGKNYPSAGENIDPNTAAPLSDGAPSIQNEGSYPRSDEGDPFIQNEGASPGSPKAVSFPPSLLIPREMCNIRFL
jgi:hypothetical protein